MTIPTEYIHYLVDGGILVMLWRGVRAANKWYDVLTEYPPHRHVQGGVVLYPKGMEPGQAGRVNGDNRT